MGFKIVKGVPEVAWFPASCETGPTANKFYIGQLVECNTGGVYPLKAAAAAPEVASYPFGIVLGFNTEPGLATYDSTYKAETASSVITKATLIAKYGHVAFTEGMTHKGELQLMVKVAIISCNPYIRVEGPIFNGTFGVAPSVVTCTVADTDGLTGMVHSAADSTFVANNNMYFGRTGKNAGVYRQSYANSATTPTFYSPWPNSWVVGDTYCATNVGLGRQYVEFGAAGVGMFVDNSDGLSQAFVVNVFSMNLEVAGQETIQFSFASYPHI